MYAKMIVAFIAASTIGAVSLGGTVSAQGTASQGQAAPGKRVFQQANCMGCHKWHGGGGGGYGGNALSLRATQLERNQIVETVLCGRPGTGMPYFQRDAYDGDEHPCYGLGRQDLGKDMPVAGGTFLRPNEVAAVTDYVLAEIKGKGEPTYAECSAFFGQGARVCNVYRAGQPATEEAQPGNRGH